MKRVLTYIGLGLALLVVIVIIVVGLLFLVPSLSLFGTRSVSLSNHYTRYNDEGIKALLAHRNIIIESNNIDVEIASRKYGQSAEDSIIIFENASGIAFNSINRTLIDYLQVIDDDGEVWHKIVILEPQGAVSMKGFVTINLFANDESELRPEEYRQPYNIILNTRNSRVKIGTDPDSTYFRIDNIHVNNAWGKITLPAVKSTQQPVLDLGNVTVGSAAKVSFDCRAPITGSLTVNSSNCAFSMGDIGKDVTINGSYNTFNNYSGSISGDVRVEGNNSRFTAGKIAGDVFYKASTGSLSIAECRRLEAEVGAANVSVSGKIDGGVNTDGVPELKFTGTGSGSCKVNRIIGVSQVSSDSGTVELRKAAGAVTVHNRLGSTVVEFDATLDPNMHNPPTCNISAWNGNVTVNNIIGPTQITAHEYDDIGVGKTRVFASFRAFNGFSKIEMQGETDTRNRYHSVEVTVIAIRNKEVAPFNVTAMHTRRARHYATFITNNDSSAEKQGSQTYYVMTNGRTYHAGVGSAANALVVDTDDWFDMFVKAVSQT